MSGLSFTVGLFVLLIITGAVWCLDRFSWKAKRKALAEQAVQQFDQQAGVSTGRTVDSETEVHRQKIYAQKFRGSWLTEFCVSIFPVILFVFTLRSFIVEPFRIPSGSMIPTLEIGDMILVNKFAYGVRLPIVHTKIIPTGKPERGDVMVFRYPKNPSEDYIKRVIGVPGDTVRYIGKQLTINGIPTVQTATGWYQSTDPARPGSMRNWQEQMNGFTYNVITDPNSFSGLEHFDLDMPFRENCQYLEGGFQCVVPAGHYFMMGDNRDNSMDSRFWGFVPEENIVGKAFFVWMHISDFSFDLSRIGTIH